MHNGIIFGIKMSIKKFKISKNPTKEELKSLLSFLKNYPQDEIPFIHIRKLAEALGAEYLDKGNRGKGSSERFRHKILNNYRGYNGIVSIHIKHKGGDRVMVYRSNFKKYLYPVLDLMVNSKNK